MTIRKTISLTALTLMVLGGSTFGISRMSATPVHAQTATPQVQAASQVKVEAKEGLEGVEPANEQAREKNLPGGGHQDQGETDHQFEGIE